MASKVIVMALNDDEGDRRTKRSFVRIKCWSAVEVWIEEGSCKMAGGC